MVPMNLKVILILINCVFLKKKGKIEIEESEIREVEMKKSIPTVPGDKTICFPVADEKEYDKLIKQTKAFRKYLDEQIALHPELFPKEIEAGYRFHGFRTSAKLKLESRRIRLVRDKE